ncbi:Dual specificity protein kinase zak2, partial [Leucoagaricus sp. SymC.cos]
RWMQMSMKELVMWAHFSHPNVLPLYGVMLVDGNWSPVSPWMEHDNLSKYLRKNRDSPRPQLILEVLSGLAYLHGMDVVHGDLKSLNILISSDQHAVITDFGLSQAATATAAGFTIPGESFSGRWTAPEILSKEALDARTIRPTKESDIWGLACVIYEVMSRQLPYFRLKIAQVMVALHRKELPERPDGTSPDFEFIDDHFLTERAAHTKVLREKPELQAHETNQLFSVLSRFSELDNAIVPKCIALRGLEGFDKVEFNLKHEGLEGVRVYATTYKQQTLCIKVVKKEYIEHMKVLFIGWTRIKHENIVPFYGIFALGENAMCLLYPWLQRNLVEYISGNPQLSQGKRSPLIADVAHGLKHLHDLGIVHGKLNCNNVLVSSHGNALLTDIQIRSLNTIDIAAINATGGGDKESGRWTAPEVLDGGENTVASDLWAFGCLIYFVLSRNKPYYEITRQRRLMVEIASRKRLPSRPSEGNDRIDDKAWEATKRFWDTDEAARLRPWDDILRDLREAIPSSFVNGKAAEDFKSSDNFWAEARDSGDIHLDVVDVERVRALL